MEQCIGMCTESVRYLNLFLLTYSSKSSSLYALTASMSSAASWNMALSSSESEHTAKYKGNSFIHLE
jgi:hypothetical protein